MIELINVSKSFGETMALQPTSLRIEPGRSTALIGPSGCGKSTLLRLMLGLIDPTQGEVRVFGQRVVGREWEGVRRRCGYVIQEGGLFPHLTARENVTLVARHIGQASSEIEARLGELVALTQFPSDALDRYPTELSGGQRQRVAVMRALMLDPEVLLLDEPLGALDPMVRAALQRDLREIFDGLGKTVVLVTHDLPEAGYLADTIVLLNEGRIVQTGTLDELRTSPSSEFVTAFVSAQRSLVAL